MLFEYGTWTNERNIWKLREAVELSIRCGNTSSAYVYARLAARWVLDNVLDRE